jgi:hypothetical protein
VSIDRNFLKNTARMLALLACASTLCLGGLSSCISPDLEPPGGGSPTLPSGRGPMTDQESAEPTAANTGSGAPGASDASANPGAPTTVTPGMQGAGGTGANNGLPSGMSTPGQTPGSATPPTIGGGAGSAASTGADGDLDAGTAMPTP